MAAIDVTGLLRPGLLDGVHVLVAGVARGEGSVAGGPARGDLGVGDPGAGDPITAGSVPAESELGPVVAEGCRELGARVRTREAHAEDEEAMDAVAAAGEIDMLVVDGAALFDSRATFARGLSAGGPVEGAAGHAGVTPGHAALRACLDSGWNVTRAVINHAFLAGERGGRVVYLAPAPDAGELAEAARAGLENLARTLSIEWARHGVNVLCIAPGTGTPAGEVAALCAYLASPAGAYFSGCLLDLRGP